jgi:hypothetical protein
VVTGGSGSGNYAAGTEVSITAAEPAAGKLFDAWTGDVSYVADVKAATTTLTMPNVDVSVTATYKNEPLDGIIIPGGTGHQVTVQDTFFYDDGGKYADYTNFFTGEITFKPALAGQRIQLEFLTFGIEDTSDGRAWDTLKIFNGSSTAAPQLGAWWGKNSPGVVLSTASDGSLTVRFATDEWSGGFGWRAHVVAMGASAARTSLRGLPQSFDLSVSGNRLRYQVPASAAGMTPVTLGLYDLRGALVTTLVQATLPAGYYTASMDRGADGKATAAGTYICRITGRGFSKAVRINYLR